MSISLTPRAQKLLAIITPFGIFLPKRTPFGHKTSPSAFCFAMYSMLDGMPGVLFYMDDILVMGNSDEELCENTVAVMKRLSAYNLKIQLSKMRLWEDQVKVFGGYF